MSRIFRELVKGLKGGSIEQEEQVAEDLGGEARFDSGARVRIQTRFSGDCDDYDDCDDCD